MDRQPERTRTSAFGAGRREGHDATAFYERFVPPELSDDETVNWSADLAASLGGPDSGRRSGTLFDGSIDKLRNLPDRSVALVVTSPPYFVGKEYELAVTGASDPDNPIPSTYLEYLDLLRSVFAECVRVLEPGGRIAVNVANLGRKPYRSLSADVIAILQDDLGLLLRGEVLWEKSETSSGSCAWGSFGKATNPVLRDMTERVVVASKGRFARALSTKQRKQRGLPHQSTLTNDEFVEVTRDVWRIEAESARRVGHPAPFPVELPRRLIDLYTFVDDIVVDPFAGSGSTLVAAAQAGRIGVGYDTEPSYTELARQRLHDELERLDRLDQLDRTSRFEVGELDVDDRQHLYRRWAVAESQKVQDLARSALHEAGFVDLHDKAKHRSGLTEFDFRIDSPPPASCSWWVDVAGAFTTAKPGLQRTDLVWRLLGRLHTLTAQADGLAGDRVLVLTPSLPRPGSPSDRALRSVGPAVIFDVIELFDPNGLARLAAYASGSPLLPGFWPEPLLESNP